MSGNTNSNQSGSPENFVGDFTELTERAVDYIHTILSTDSTLFVDSFPSVQAAFDAFVLSDKPILAFSNRQYILPANVTSGVLIDKIIQGNNAELVLPTSAVTIGLTISIGSGNVKINDLNFSGIANDTSQGSQTGLYCQNTVNGMGVIVNGCTFYNLYQGIVPLGGSSSIMSFIRECYFVHNGFGILSVGEYWSVMDCNFYNNLYAGIKVTTGNNRIINNTINANSIGIIVDSSGGGNADHGLILGNSINHNSKCGIHIKNLIFSMDILDNEIWANFGVPLGVAPIDSAYGICIENGTGVNISNNSISRNLFNVAVYGINKSRINNNTFLADNALTIRHIYEIGGVNASYQIANNTLQDDLDGNVIDLALDCPNATLGDNIIA